MAIRVADGHQKIIKMIRHLLAPHVPRPPPPSVSSGRWPAGSRSRSMTDPTPRAPLRSSRSWRTSGIKATFFLVGEQVERRPSLAAEIAGQGHLIALHGYRHRPQPAMPQEAVQRDVALGLEAIEAATQTRPAWHRPPYGLYSPAGLRAVRATGLEPLLWSRWGKDWRRFTTPERIASRVTANLRPGDVILLHDADFYSSRGSHERTAQALKIIVRELKRQKISTVLPV